MLVSCTDKCEKCQKTIRKELDKGAPANFEEALAVYDFEAAHKYLACYSDNNQAYSTHKVQLGRSEIAYLVSQGEIAKARTTARELGKIGRQYDFRIIFNDILAGAIPTMIDNQQYDAVINSLSSWEFLYDFQEKVSETENPDRVNLNYNSEANSYNDLVDALLLKALLMKNKTLVDQCLLLYIPNAFEVSRRRPREGVAEYEVKHELKNTYKLEAMKKIKESGLLSTTNNGIAK